MTENLYAVKSIRTFSGRYVNVFEPDPDTLLIEDIAHALSNQPRFGGHLPQFYSVAQHSLLCYQIADEQYKYDALMHDASEAYLLDMPKPIKLEMPDYNRIEDNLMYILSFKFRFNYPKTTPVETIDHHLLNWEWNNIMLKKKPTAKYPLIKILTPKQAKAAFLKAYNKCQEKRNLSNLAL